MLPLMEFAYNATRGLGIERTPFEANSGFSHEEPSHILFSMRPWIPVSQDAYDRFKLLHELHAIVRSVLHMRNDDMLARSKQPIAPHHARGEKVTVVTKNLFL
jgi:hypothetical protein